MNPRSYDMDDRVLDTLDHNQVIDITTTGRRTGQPRRIEIFLHNLDGRLIISGIPRPGRTRAWLRNVTADPHNMHPSGASGCSRPQNHAALCKALTGRYRFDGRYRGSWVCC